MPNEHMVNIDELPVSEQQNMLIQEKYDRMDLLTYGNGKRKEGMTIGEKKGESKLAELMDKLFALSRLDDTKKAVKDDKFREKLFKEFQIL